jgi:hypothetical protein
MLYSTGINEIRGLAQYKITGAWTPSTGINEIKDWLKMNLARVGCVLHTNAIKLSSFIS